MKEISITVDTKIDLHELAKQLTVEDMLDLFCMAANKITEKGPYDNRRGLIALASDNLSEFAIRTLAEIVAANYSSKLIKKEGIG